MNIVYKLILGLEVKYECMKAAATFSSFVDSLIINYLNNAYNVSTLLIKKKCFALSNRTKTPETFGITVAKTR